MLASQRRQYRTIQSLDTDRKVLPKGMEGCEENQPSIHANLTPCQREPWYCYLHSDETWREDVGSLVRHRVILGTQYARFAFMTTPRH